MSFFPHPLFFHFQLFHCRRLLHGLPSLLRLTILFLLLFLVHFRTFVPHLHEGEQEEAGSGRPLARGDGRRPRQRTEKEEETQSTQQSTCFFSAHGEEVRCHERLLLHVTCLNLQLATGWWMQSGHINRLGRAHTNEGHSLLSVVLRFHLQVLFFDSLPHHAHRSLHLTCQMRHSEGDVENELYGLSSCAIVGVPHYPRSTRRQQQER